MLSEMNDIGGRFSSLYKFTEEDHRMLRVYYGVIDGISTLFGKQCEVILYSLENFDCSAIKICRGIDTLEVEGSPISDLALNMLQDISTQNKQCSKAFFSQTKDGQMIRSISIAIKNRTDITIGLILININLNVCFIDFIQELIPAFEEKEAVSSVNFANTVKELVTRSVEETILEINSRTDIANNTKNRDIVISLFQQGIFDIKDAINLVANRLNISKHTVYLYIRQIKSDNVKS